RHRPPQADRALLLAVPPRLAHALPDVAAFIAVTKLHCFVGTGGRARWDGCASDVAGLEDDVDLYRGVSARVEDLSPLDAHDRGSAHRSSASAPFGSSWASPISSTTWSKSSPSSSPPSCWPIVLAQRAMLFGSFSS